MTLIIIIGKAKQIKITLLRIKSKMNFKVQMNLIKRGPHKGYFNSNKIN